MEDSDLFRSIRAYLSEEDRAALLAFSRKPDSEDYELVIGRVVRGLPKLKEQVDRNSARVEQGYGSILELPPARFRVLVENSPPPLLATLAIWLIRRSFEERFCAPDSSARLATLGLRVTQQLRKTEYLGPQVHIDLEAEAWIYLGNARRVNSDLPGAEKCFKQAWRLVHRGTGDDRLLADFYFLKACLRFTQGRIEEAAALYDREIRLRRRIGEPGAIGRSLVDRGIVAALRGSLSEALDFLGKGAELTEDEDCLIICLHPIAERLARDGDALLAWKVVCAAENTARLLQNTKHDARLAWIKGVTHRACGELGRARRQLEVVREEFIAKGRTFMAALVSLDLAAVLAGEQDHQGVRKLAHEAYEVFRAEGLDEQALAAFLVFHRAAERQELTEELAVRIANYVTAQQYDRSLSFENFLRRQEEVAPR